MSWPAPRNRAQRFPWRQRLVWLAAALTLAGCGRGAPPPSPAPPEAAPTTPEEVLEEGQVPAAAETTAAPSPGYDGSSGYSPALDTAPLRGRRIVLDPGHGGRWAGSLGVAGTREADINLSVARSLEGLLRGAGARVHLTRATDMDFKSADDSSLVYDLKARAAFADSLQAEVFLSLHHNADAGSRRDVNETQTYYRRGDDGPSLDLAQDLHRRLVQALRLDLARLRPGNYSVLRNTGADAACLLEPSYLTYPPVESLLRDTTAIRLEAEAYFMGLLDYFSRGTPAVLAVVWDSLWTGPPAWRPLVARLSEAPLTLDWTVGGERLSTASWTPRQSANGDAFEAVLAPDTPWRDGPLIAQVRARGQGGNHTPAVSETLVVELPAARLRLDVIPPSVGAVGPAALQVSLLDAWDRPLADTLRAGELEWFVAGAPHDVERFRTGQPWESRGVTRVYWVSLPAVVQHGGVEVRWRGLRSSPFVLTPGDPPQWRTGFVRVQGDSLALGGITVRTRDGKVSARTDARGFYALPWKSSDRLEALEAEAPGFEFLRSASVDTPVVAPIAGGLLLGRRIAVDPIGGGDDADGTAPGGSLGSPINLLVARLLRGFLQGAGADVLLMRTTESRRTDEERVELAERFGAERVVRIGRRVGGPSAVGHFPGSPGGQRLATAIHARLAPRQTAYAKAAGVPVPREAIVWEDAGWVLQQTSCPAVSVRVGDFSSEPGERRILDPIWQVREAYAIYAGLIEDLAQEMGPDSARPELVEVEILFRDANRPLRGLLVELGGSELLTDGAGVARFEALAADRPHRLRARFPGSNEVRTGSIHPAAARVWAWDRERPDPEALRGR